MRAQYAMEYLIVIALILGLLIPTLYLALNRSNLASITEQASTAVNTIAGIADEVYFLGPGNKNTISISVPATVQSFNVSKNEVIMTIRIDDKTSDFVALTKANLTGTLPTSRGLKYITVEHLDSGEVNISST